MLILSLFFAVILMHVGRDISEQGISIYQNPRFWVQIVTIVLIAYVTAMT